VRLRWTWIAAALFLAFAGSVVPAQPQKLTLQLESREVYADLPFVLALTAEGFQESPQPEAPELAIEGCEVHFTGVSPNISSGVRIINGRRSEWRHVTFVYRYRIAASKPGDYTVPALTVTQGKKSATTPGGSFTVQAVSSTGDMKLRLELPERPVWIGETFPVYVEWLLRRDVGEHSLVVPLFYLDRVQVQPGPEQSSRTLSFNAGALNVELPYVQEKVNVDGATYTRLRFSSLVTVNRPGAIELEPAKVAAALEVGQTRDAFGFRRPRYQLFKAEDKPRRLNVRPLPMEGRPDSFENAIGTRYSIGTQASRTVVRVGDPIQLTIRIRGDGPLEGLSLPRLDGEDGLAANLFSVADDSSVGVLDPEGGGKTFEVTVRINSADATEIPPLAFSYFDPVAGAYRTIRSDPVALSVAGSAVVGAAEVAAASPAGPRGDAAGASGTTGSATAPGAGPAMLIGADLSLGPLEDTFRGAWTPGSVAPWIIALYLFPLVVLGVRLWQVRTQGTRGREKEVRQALREVEAALDAGSAARDAAPRIVTAVRTLGRLTGREDELATGALERLETHAFDPQAGELPLPSEQVERVRSLVQGWVDAALEKTTGSNTFVCLLLGLVTLAAISATAQATGEDDLERVRSARAVYQAALEEPDRVLRTRKFGEAERLFTELLPRHENSPDLLTDWGNAALGSQEIGRAALAYRRALRLDPNHDRARKNLVWLRTRAPEWVPRPQEQGVLDSLFFWHHRLAVSLRLLLGALAFAAAVLLLAPWPVRRPRLLRRLAIPFLLIWIAMAGSTMLEPDPSRDAVVVADGTFLRSADSLGAPPSLSNPLPAGTEVRIIENRAAWTRITLADGTRGWVGSSAVESVVP